MKCVIILKGARSGEIVRVPNSEAKHLVETNLAKYSSKQAWKDAGRKR